MTVAWLTCVLLCGTAGFAAVPPASPAPVPGEIRVEPPAVALDHHRRPHSLIVTTTTPDGLTVDLTLQARYESSDPKIATVDAAGRVAPVAGGTARVTVTAAGKSAAVDVTVTLPPAPRPVSFRHDVMPVLSKAACNSGACHGYSLGKNGFKLSLRGADAAQDYQSLTDEFFERRINRHHPPASLLLAKPLGEVKHEGGLRLRRGSPAHETLLNWIAEGAGGDVADPVQLQSVHIYPTEIVLPPGSTQRLQLVAHYSDGSRRDVTPLGIFTANTDSVAGVDEEGVIAARLIGETAVVARFERIFATANVIVLKPDPAFQPSPVPTENFVDTHVVRKLNALRITPSAAADDATFLRRVYVDLIGLQPKPDEVRAFLADADPAKRAKTVDALFARPEFVDWWSLKWGDLLQNSRAKLSPQAVFAFREWIRSSVATNKPLDRFARELLAGRGGFMEDPTSAYFAVSQDADETLQRTTQVFCGVRMLCAKCHPHPFENWTQGDYYGLHSFFNQVGVKGDQRLRNVANAKSVVLNLAAGHSTNPRTGQPQPPRYLGGAEPPVEPNADRRAAYAAWLTAAENPYFARSMANRVWSYFFHRGVIHPVDDLRTTNPPINPELLDALAKDFADHRFDVRHLMRRIVTSQTYQRGSAPNATNAHDEANFSRFVPRRVPAEALLDSLVQATGVAEPFGNAPGGFTAAQLPDANVQSDFLSLFGKPARAEACECERENTSNMLQALSFINGKTLLGKVAEASARPAQLVNQPEPKLTDEQVIEQLYLWALARPPAPPEAQASLTFFKTYGDKRVEAAQDLMWALLNSRDFTMVN